MPLLTVLAPGTPVEVPGMALPNARVKAVRLAEGPNPVTYVVAWRERPGAPERTVEFRNTDRVIEREPDPLAGPLGNAGRVGDLGNMIARGMGEAANQPGG